MPIRKISAARFLTGASVLALAFCAAPALAANYTATDQTSLNNDITTANGDGDPSSTITLGNNVQMTNPALNTVNKNLTIDSGSFTFTRTYTGSTSSGVLEFAGGTGTATLKGTVTGVNGGGPTDVGQVGLFLSSATVINDATVTAGDGSGTGAGGTGFATLGAATLINNGSIISGNSTGGSNGGNGGLLQNGATVINNAGGSIIAGNGVSGGAGLSATVGLTVVTITNSGTIKGGNGTTGNGGIGITATHGSTITNNTGGAITGGDGANGGVGVNEAGFSAAQAGTLTNSGSITGGNGTSVSGGFGVSIGNFSSLNNSGTITGGGGVVGAAGVNVTGNAATPSTITNSGTIQGGNGSSGAGGSGILVNANVGTMTNGGSIIGGAGAAAIMDTGAAGATNAPVSLVNSGTITAGAGYADAILMQVPSNLTLELDKGSMITGAVVGNTGAAANTLILGGDGNASFDVSTVGSQYQNFTAYQKTGNSVWSITGVGSTATPWVISQGTLQMSDGASMIGDVTNNATLGFNNSGALTFANTVTGTGGVNQTGSGRTNLTGASTYTGPTVISAGTLAVNGSITSAVTVASGGTLGGNGTVGATTAQSGGTIAPGNSIGTLHVNGAFVQSAGSIYQVEVDPTSNASDLILVNGAATVDNSATLNVVKNPTGDYRPGAHYTVLTASGGVAGSYTLPNAGTISQFLALQETQDANDIYLNVIQTGNPASAAQTGNQTSVANNLPNGNGATMPILNVPSDAAARGAFDALSGEALASARGALVSGSLLVRDTAFDRLRDICSSGDSDAVQRPGCLAGDRPLLWVQGFGDWGHINGNGNAAGISQATGGFLVGTDVPVYDWRVGVFGGFSRTSFDVDARDSWGVSDNYHLGAYGGGMVDDIALKLGASYSWNNLATERVVAIGDFVNDLTARYNAGTTQIFGEAGQSFAFDGFTAEPFANLAYANLRTGNFRETGGDAALTSQANTMEDTFTTLGVRPATDFSIGTFALQVDGMLGWRHTFGEVTPNSTVSFAGGNAFTVEGAPIARDAAVIEAGLHANVSNRTAVALTYGGQFSGRETDNGIRGTLDIAF